MGTELVAGVFHSGERLLAATRAARARGFSIFDAYTPFPVHGMDEAMGLPPSALPKVCFRFGAAGLLGTLAFQYWVSLFDWPMNVGGKSYDASPALLPVAFELTVLCAGLGTVLWFLASRRLHPRRPPRLASSGAVDSRFVLALRCARGAVDETSLRRFLEEQGAARVIREEVLEA